MLGHSGIGRYLKEIILSWAEMAEIEELTAFGPPQETWRGLHLPKHFVQVPFSAPIYSVREQLVGALRLRFAGSRCNILWAPHINVPVMSRGPLVVTVHDLIHLRFPHHFPSARLAALRAIIPLVLWRAKRVITVSETTRQDLETFYPWSRGRIRVIPSGVSQSFRLLPNSDVTTVTRKWALPPNYLLYVGNFKRIKNLETLVEAFSQIARRHRSVFLVLIGNAFPEYQSVRRIIDREGLDQRVIQRTAVPDHDLVALMNGALALVLPSHWEGFGLTILEGMACGTPVVASNIPAVREVSGGAASLYGDPTSVDGLVQALERVITDQAYRFRMIEMGLERARTSSWEEAGQRTLAVLHEAISL